MEITSENAFVQFGSPAPEGLLCLRYLSDLAFPCTNVNDILQIVDEAGTALFTFNESKAATYFFDGSTVRGAGILSATTFFRFFLPGEGLYSNSLKIACEDHTSLLKYWNDEAAFGFEYPEGSFCKIRLPITLEKPQFPQEDKIYKKTTGERVVLFSAIDREYDLVTDYLTEEEHRKIVIALAHDHVEINGQRLTKTGEYKIDWPDDYPTAPASCKMGSNITLRNSNCR